MWNVLYITLLLFGLATALVAVGALVLPGGLVGIIYAGTVILLVMSTLHWLKLF